MLEKRFEKHVRHRTCVWHILWIAEKEDRKTCVAPHIYLAPLWNFVKIRSTKLCAAPHKFLEGLLWHLKDPYKILNHVGKEARKICTILHMYLAPHLECWKWGSKNMCGIAHLFDTSLEFIKWGLKNLYGTAHVFDTSLGMLEKKFEKLVQYYTFIWNILGIFIKEGPKMCEVPHKFFAPFVVQRHGPKDPRKLVRHRTHFLGFIWSFVMEHVWRCRAAYLYTPP